ncbi:MAG: hypothetical protein Kapaf2KO_21010 [Candidatus Kapaibacteriales bacterium]
MMFSEVNKLNTSARCVAEIIQRINNSDNFVGKKELVVREFSLMEVIKLAVRQNKPTLSARGQKVTIDLESDTHNIIQDKLLVFQITDELLCNASTFGTKSTEIVIAANSDGTNTPTLTVSVKSYGNSIDEKVKSKIFKSPIKKKNKTCYGLYIASRIANRIGGNLSYSYFDEQNIFTLELPIMKVSGEADVQVLGI